MPKSIRILYICTTMSLDEGTGGTGNSYSSIENISFRAAKHRRAHEILRITGYVQALFQSVA